MYYRKQLRGDAGSYSFAPFLNQLVGFCKSNKRKPNGYVEFFFSCVCTVKALVTVRHITIWVALKHSRVDLI